MTELTERVGITAPNMSILKTDGAGTMKVSTLAKLYEALVFSARQRTGVREGRRGRGMTGCNAFPKTKSAVSYGISSISSRSCVQLRPFTTIKCCRKPRLNAELLVHACCRRLQSVAIGNSPSCIAGLPADMARRLLAAIAHPTQPPGEPLFHEQGSLRYECISSNHVAALPHQAWHV